MCYRNREMTNTCVLLELNVPFKSEGCVLRSTGGLLSGFLTGHIFKPLILPSFPLSVTPLSSNLQILSLVVSVLFQ
jgi:hypothetical protein